MTAVLSGTNGLLQSYDYQVLTTGFGYTFAAGVQVLVINPAGTLATGTVTMPAAPADGMTITVESTQQVTAITVNANTGQSIVGAAVQLIPNQPLSWVYRLANTTWYPFFGGAGRASSLVSGTAVATTSGTSIDFTSIPSWVKRITVMFNAVSTTGSSDLTVQLGTSSGVTTSGYRGAAQRGTGAISDTNGFNVTSTIASGTLMNGSITLCLLDATNYIWAQSGVLGHSDGAAVAQSGGSVTLASALTRVRLTTVGGTDTFDAGSINILYE